MNPSYACENCGMHVRSREWHPLAACYMYRHLGSHDLVRLHLAWIYEQFFGGRDAGLPRIVLEDGVLLLAERDTHNKEDSP